MKVYENILEMVGHTPMLEIKNLDTGLCRLFLKLELMNPGGSIKDRIGASMIAEAEKRGELKPGDTIVEATAGNTGIGLALAAAGKGYNLILVVPDKMSQEKIFNLRAMGAEVVLTRSDVGKGHPEYYQDLGKRIAEEKGAYYINQFGNPDNPRAHERTTAPEIWQQMDQRLDAIVLGVGSSGTITGLTRFFRREAPHLTMVLADPRGSILAEYVKTGQTGSTEGSWRVEGIGEDFLPSICDLSFTTVAYSIDDRESFAVARQLLNKEGVLAGSSTGTCLAAALRYCREQTTPQRVVTFACDTGSRYLSKMYNDLWLEDEGLVERQSEGDLSDLIDRRHQQGATVCVTPEDQLTSAHHRMRNAGISQVAVLKEETLVGVIGEEDILRHVYGNPHRMADPVSAAMQRSVQTVTKSMSTDQLATHLETHIWAAITDGRRFLGLITRTDLIHHLNKKHLGKGSKDEAT